MKSHILLLTLAVPALSCSTQLAEPEGEVPSLGRSAQADEGDSIARPKEAWATDDAQLGRAVHYYDGETKRTLWLDESRVAEFTPSASSSQALAASFPGAREAAGSFGRVKIWDVNRSPEIAQYVGDLNGLHADASFSPVLRDAQSEHASMKALPGGVLVVLDAAWSEQEVRDWLVSRGHAVRQSLPTAPNAFVIDTPVGMESLEIANALFESGDVVSASPNFWKESATR